MATVVCVLLFRRLARRQKGPPRVAPHPGPSGSVVHRRLPASMPNPVGGMQETPPPAPSHCEGPCRLPLPPCAMHSPSASAPRPYIGALTSAGHSAGRVRLGTSPQRHPKVPNRCGSGRLCTPRSAVSGPPIALGAREHLSHRHVLAIQKTTLDALVACAHGGSEYV